MYLFTFISNTKEFYKLDENFNLIKTTVFVKNISDFSTINEIYATYFKNNPARSLVEVAALPKNALIEIECIAIIK